MNYDLIIAGLGNPGAKYQATRHNAGFLAVDQIARYYGVDFESDKKNRVEKAEVLINGFKVFLVKPMDFMNKSGETLKSFFDYYGLDLSMDIDGKNKTDKIFFGNGGYERMIIIQDDSDIKEGGFKISVSRGGAGHKGLENIFKVFKKDNFIRLRIGIRPLGSLARSQEFVLKRFSSQSELASTILKIPQVVDCLTMKGISACQSLFHT